MKQQLNNVPRTIGQLPHIKSTWLGVQPTITRPTDSSKRVARCKPWPSYYHPPRVVTFIIMAIRKAIATQFSKAAKALENDTSKETITTTIYALRVGIANVIMPKIPLSK